MKTNLKKVYSKLPNKKVNLKAQKVALGLVDDISYDYSNLEEEVSRLEYLLDEFLPQEFDRLDEAYALLKEVLIDNSENVIYYDDVAQDEETIQSIREKADELGIDANEIFPNIDNYSEELARLRNLSEEFEMSVRQFRNY
ncbi:hypothetical protein [uncultured Wocania sp.]|uniref:hypothetical protein n=1 Tax=uncultured Wocania sp. TaxID=2834404 RepID=UPI0030F65317